MADINYRPSPLPVKLGPTKDENDGLLLTLLELLDIELTENLFTGNFTTLEYADLINGSFGEFQTWCWEIYVSMADNKDKTYYFFKDALIRYQTKKNKNFFEKENQIYHVLVTLPISKEGDRMQQMANINYEYMNKAICVLEDYLRKEPPSKNDNPPPPTQKIHGFRVKNHKCLKDAFDQLIDKDFIDEATSIFDFEKVFFGRIPDHKITWLKGPGLLRYFIKSLNNKGIEDEKKFIWKTTINCFQDKNQNAFTIKQLRFAKKPSNTDDIDSVRDTINEDASSED